MQTMPSGESFASETQVEQCQSYILRQLEVKWKPTSLRKPLPPGPAITISYQTGSGAGLAVGLLGVVSLSVGIMVLTNTWIGVAVFPYIIGITELAGGCVVFFLAFKLLGAQRQRSTSQQSR